MQLSNEKELTFNFMFMAQKYKDKFSFFLLFLIFFPPCIHESKKFLSKTLKKLILLSQEKNAAIERKGPAIIIATVGSQPIRWESLKPK